MFWIANHWLCWPLSYRTWCQVIGGERSQGRGVTLQRPALATLLLPLVRLSTGHLVGAKLRRGGTSSRLHLHHNSLHSHHQDILVAGDYYIARPRTTKAQATTRPQRSTQ